MCLNSKEDESQFQHDTQMLHITILDKKISPHLPPSSIPFLHRRYGAQMQRCIATRWTWTRFWIQLVAVDDSAHANPRSSNLYARMEKFRSGVGFLLFEPSSGEMWTCRRIYDSGTVIEKGNMTYVGP